MKKRLAMLAICLMLIVGFSVCLTLNNNLFASEEFTYTCEINGVTAHFTYNLTEDNKVENLKCTNKNDLTGNITIPSLIDEKEVISIENNAFSGASNITGVVIPDTIETIEFNAFANCTNLKNVDLGSVKGISFDAFSNCTALEEITIPKTVVNDTTGAPFRGCTNLKTITLEEGITKIPMYLCAGTPIEEIVIPNSVESIHGKAFANCTNLKNVDLGSVKGISFDAFENCTTLEEITIPKTVVNDTTGAPFRGCTNLRTITLEEGITKIPMYLCAETGIEEIVIPNSVESISYRAFSNCLNLKKITILDNVTSMGFALSGGEVFTNHNENLTIYCYRDTMAAKHAIDYNIKYVYLDRPDNGDNNNNNNNNNNDNLENNENVDNNEQVVEDSNDKNNKDTIIDESNNPKTGDEILYVLAALLVAILSYTFFSKSFKQVK